MMYCPNCGTKLGEGARFCPECGEKVPPAEASSGAAQPSFGGAPAEGPEEPAEDARSAARGRIAFFAVVLATAAALLFIFVIRPKILQKQKDNTLSFLMTLPSETAAAASGTAGTEAAGTAGGGAETEAPTEAPTADVTQGMPSFDGTVSDAEAEAVFEKLTGCWNTPDNKRFFSVERQQDGRYFFVIGNWYSEADFLAYLQTPVRGDPNGEASVHMFYEPEGEGGGMEYGSMDTDVRVDLTKAENGTVLWLFENGWEEFRYAGATPEEAMPDERTALR